MIVNGTNVSMTRGDTENLEIYCQNNAGVEIPFVDGDTVYFTVKKSPNTTEKILQKVITEFINGKAYAQIESSDTKTLNYGDYVYDVQYNTAAGVVRTIIPISQFTISKEVTYE